MRAKHDESKLKPGYEGGRGREGNVHEWRGRGIHSTAPEMMRQPDGEWETITSDRRDNK